MSERLDRIEAGLEETRKIVELYTTGLEETRKIVELNAKAIMALASQGAELDARLERTSAAVDR